VWTRTAPGPSASFYQSALRGFSDGLKVPELLVAGVVQRLDADCAPDRALDLPTIENCLDYQHGGIDVLDDLVAPKAKNPPAQLLQFKRLPPITCDVVRELLAPEVGVRPRTSIVIRAAMPLATVHEDRNAPSQECYVRPAPLGWGLAMHPVSVTPGPKRLPKEQLGLRVGATNAGHLLGAGERHQPSL